MISSIKSILVFIKFVVQKRPKTRWLEPLNARNFEELSGQRINIHLVPRKVKVRIDPYHGLSKGIWQISDAFKTEGVRLVDAYLIGSGTNGVLGLTLFLFYVKRYRINLESIILSFTGRYYLLVIACRILFPRTSIICRAHNPEFTHRLDYVRATKPRKSKIYSIKDAILGLLNDFILLIFSNVVLPVSRDDTYNYWRHFRFGKIQFLQYLPMQISKKSPNQRKKRFLIASIGSAHPGAVANDQQLNFYRLVSGIDLPEKYNFIQTSARRDGRAPINVITLQANLSNFPDFLEHVLVVLVCGKYGRGTKTKIADAVALGIPVLTTVELYERLDVEFKQGVFKYDNEEEFEKKLFETISYAEKIEVFEERAQQQVNFQNMTIGARHALNGYLTEEKTQRRHQYTRPDGKLNFCFGTVLYDRPSQFVESWNSLHIILEKQRRLRRWEGHP